MQWANLKNHLEKKYDATITILILLREKLPYKTKAEEEKYRLQAVKNANIHFNDRSPLQSS